MTPGKSALLLLAAMVPACAAAGEARSPLLSRQALLPFAFVTAPMWAASALLAGAQLVPSSATPESAPHHDEGSVPAPASAPSSDDSGGKPSSKEVQDLRQQIADLTAKLKESEEAVAKLGDPPVGKFFDSLGSQCTLAIVLGFIGFLSVVGPSTFVRLFLAIAGSAVGGLMVAGSVDYFRSEVGVSWFQCLHALVNGGGLPAGYHTWGVLLLLGFVRWFTGWECGLYAVVEEMDLTDGTTPLLDAQGKPVTDQV